MKEVIQKAREVFDIDLGLQDLTSGSQFIDRFDLTGIVLASSKICWKAGSTKKEKAFDDPDVSIIGDITKGQVQGILDTTETDSFPAEELGSIEVLIDKGAGDVTKFQLLDSFQVKAKICD